MWLFLGFEVTPGMALASFLYLSCVLLSFFFYWFWNHRDLHSFPTRRSSDLRSRSKKVKPSYSSNPKDEGESSRCALMRRPDRKSTRLNSSHANISYAVFCLKKKKNQI